MVCKGNDVWINRVGRKKMIDSYVYRVIWYSQLELYDKFKYLNLIDARVFWKWSENVFVC